MYKIFEELLHERGITAYRVAKETGISTGSLTDWKMGRSSPKADKLQKIADYFGVSVDYLLGNEEKEKPTPDKDVSDELVGFYNHFRSQLSQEDKDDIKKLIQIRAELNRSGKE